MVAKASKISENVPKLGHAGEALRGRPKSLSYQLIWGKITEILKPADAIGIEPFLHGPV